MSKMKNIKDKNWNEVIELMKAGGELRREVTRETTTFKVVNDISFKEFPLKILAELKEEELVEIVHVDTLHSVYKLTKKAYEKD